MANDRRHITKRSDGDWQVITENGERASGVHNTQKEAIDHARDITQRQGGSVIIHRENGKIREERTFGKKDPFPPEG